MPDIHLFQWVIAFGAALYLTFRLFFAMPAQRWRHIMLSVIAILLWIPTAYTADNVHVADGGQTVAFGSEAIMFVGIFMILVNILGLLLGLYFWAEDEAMTANDAMPSGIRHRPDD